MDHCDSIKVNSLCRDILLNNFVFFCFNHHFHRRLKKFLKIQCMSTIEWPKTHVRANKSSFKNERIIGKSNSKQEFSKSAIERCWKSNIWDAGRKCCLCILGVRIQNAEVRWWFCILIASLDFDINFLNHNLLHTFKFGLNGVLTYYINTFWTGLT